MRYISAMKTNNVLRNIFVTLKNAVFVKAVDFISYYYVVRSLTKADYGQYAVILSIFAITSTLADMGIGNAYIKFYHAEQEKKGYMLNFLGWKISMASLFAATGSLFLWTLGRVWISQELLIPMQMMLLSMIFYSLYDFIDMHYQAAKEFDKKASFYTKNYVLRLIMTLGYVFLPVTKQPSLFLLIYFVSTGAVGLWEAFKGLRLHQVIQDHLGDLFQPHRWKTYIYYTKWILVSTIATIFITRIDSLMLYRMRGAEENAVYSVGFQLASVVGILTSSITAVLMPHLFAAKKREDIKNYVYSVSKYILPITALMILGAFFTKPVLVFFFQERYIEADPVIKILLITSAIGLYFNQINLLFYHFEKHYFIALVNYIQLILIVILNLMMIPRLGAYGAAINTLLVRIIGYGFYIGYLINLQKGKRVYDRSSNWMDQEKSYK